MPAVTPAEPHNPERYGSSNANHHQDWWRGPHDCALHLNPPPPNVEQAARLAMPAVAPAEPHNPERYGSSNAIRRQDWRRGTHDCALHFRAWPAGLRAPPQAAAPQCGASRQACHAGGRAGRATHTRAAREFQSPSAAKTGGVARTTAPSTSTRRFSSHLRVLRVLSGLVFSVPSVVCLLRVLRVLCGLLFCALPTPSHNLPQIFFPFLFNHFPTRPFSFSCSPLVC
jgi:hypothetical protein